MSPASILRPRRATVIAATLAVLAAGIGAAPAASGLAVGRVRPGRSSSR